MHASLKHILSQPFVVATGFAALVHSTWSLATLFAGHEPAQMTGAWFAWVAPALLIALSVDLGQVVTASEIRQGQRSRAKLATFGVFACFTYGLQWYHLVHHMPALALAEGVRPEWRGLAQLIVDSLIFLIPALLPLSTMLYTFSSSEVVHQESQPVSDAKAVGAQMQAVNVNIMQPLSEQRSTTAAIEPMQHVAKLAAKTGEQFSAECECGEWRGIYDSPRAATNALTAHRRKCKLSIQVQ